uniref:Immunoglobulin superfamily member 9 n=1 Tax=Malurus cyaneus samueli TaxID=2593467 RepID=A0A8C5UF62_9PASS
MSPPVHRHRCADGAVTNPHAWQCEAGSLGTGTERGAPGQGERERVDHGRGWPEGMAREGVARGMGCTGEGGMGGGGTGGGDPEYRTDPDVPVVTHTGRVRLEEGASLRLELLRPEDQGWYECRVLFLDRHSSDADFRNGTWIHLSSGVSFSHPSPTPPTFLETPPALVEVRVRSALTLTCRAAGNPQPVVTWRRSDRPVQSGAVTNGTLTIAAVGRASAGTYTCHAASKEGTATHSTRVLVQGPPVIVVPPQNVTVNVSQDAFLACQAEAYPGNLTYSWFRGGSNVFHLSHLQSRVRVLVDGSLLLQRATPDDAGRYTCTPSNGLWEPPSASAFITVLYPAEVTAMLPETPLPKGMRGVIRCPARANPPLLRVSWTKDGRPLEVDKLPGWSVRPDGSIVIATGNDDAPGLYRCTPYNSYGTAGESRPTRVLLKDPPAFTVQPKEEYFQEVGRELVIPCAAGGDPPPPAPAVSPGPPAISGILQYLSLPFFKEMCVDGDWPPPEEPAEPAGACPDHCRVPRAPPAAPRPRQGLAARFPAWPRSSSARLKARGGRWTLRARRGSEGSLTSQSSGRGRLRPPSVAPSLLGGTAGHRLGAGAAGTARLGRREGRAGWTPAGGRGEEGRQGGRGGDGMGWGLDGMGWIWIYRIYGIYGWNLGGTGRGWRDWDGYDLDLWDDGLYGIYGWNLGRDRWDGMGWDGMGWDGMGGMGLGWAGMALCTLGTLPAVPVPGIGMGLGRDWDGMGFMGFGMGWDLDGWDGMVDGMGWTGCCGRD